MSDFPIRTDTYQTAKTCVAVLYTRGVSLSNLQPRADSREVSVDVDIDGQTYTKRWVFFADINPASLKVDQGRVKTEIVLQKCAAIMWPQVEAEPVAAPPVYFQCKCMHQMPKEEEEKPVGEETKLRQLYRDADDDTRRAMMKSMVESGGKYCNPNWDEVGAAQSRPQGRKK
jgi:suppressor of G2 allele of SKP1